MSSIRVEGDTRGLMNKLKRFSEIDRKKINATLGAQVRSTTMERFKRSKDPTGKRWKTSIRAASEGGKTLIQTAQLRNSIRVKSDASGLAVGTNLVYAATHQFGDERTIRAKKAKALRFRVNGQWISKQQVRVKIPARPYLGLSEDDLQELKESVEDFIQKEH